ncbi:hypothetical protein [Sinomonas atrocyanea]|uniref:hypothetical protein n=1 Tax=Sinomonas atrocyanea TaxID=37927 RepID=UPI0027863A5B|nr:hypothetical protein [Sinomonas atrocyanea]MDQ0260933.1 putative membrane protein [Sinomonas atrocyanea]MDR6622112.1 putative membrane protein [Sinomonas atrocyanea]
MASRFRPLRTSARATLWAAGAAVLLCVVAGLTLDGGAATLALAGLGAFVTCALYAMLGMSRYLIAGLAAAGSSLAIGSGLAFLRLLGLAWDQDPNSVTTVSSRDADPFFFGALVAAAATLAMLLGGAVWPESRRAAVRPRPAAGAGARRPNRAPSSATKPAPTRAAPARARTTAARTPQRAGVPRTPAQTRTRVSPSSSNAARRS